MKKIRNAGSNPKSEIRNPKLKKEYDFGVVDTAESLYVHKQKTYEEISRALDVPVVTIQRWSEKYEWRKKKLEQVKLRVEYRRNLYVLRDQMLQSAMASTDPQVVHGIAALQRVIEMEEKMKPVDDLPANPEKNLGLTEETLSKIKEELYGIKTAKGIGHGA
jgi:hypothetical protein